MNRNNRLYSIDANGVKQFTAAGLLLQFWILSEGGGLALTEEGRRIARIVVDNVIDLWQGTASEGVTRSLPTGTPAAEMSNAQLFRVIDVIEEACLAVGSNRVFEMISHSTQPTVH